MVWPILTAVSLAGGCADVHTDGCGYQCDQVEASGPAITLTEHSALVAAIETTVSQSNHDAGPQAVCEVRWLSSTYADGYPSTPICPPWTQDAGTTSTTCPTHFDCPSYRVLSYGGCDRAWINMTVEACQVTIISATGERQDIQVTKSQDPIRSECHVGCSDSWTEVVRYPAIPATVSLTFASIDGGAVLDAGGGE
jgi:hypothetical protein